MRLNPFHSHQWVTTSEIFTSGKGWDEVASVSVDTAQGYELLERMCTGFTSIRQACSRCGAARVVEAAGDVRENHFERYLRGGRR